MCTRSMDENEMYDKWRQLEQITKQKRERLFLYVFMFYVAAMQCNEWLF